jgi:hypothetical protein
MPQVARGALAPEQLTVRIRNRDGAPPSETLDFATVSAAELRIDGAPVGTPPWPCSITATASDELSIVHPFAAGDVPQRCMLRLTAYLTTPAGVRRSATIHLEVV